ncbi:bifunctional nuclease family protein [Natranaerofaba carboxydovora]|uniref:bifunctional nuclease family protein n=1 Tax=Natranaerofaba carboxydovora TaxID=2742683 RepID=UPI001F135FE7|nr:bifunctional nuclease family protein [Natranaerofaba carboxydovora]UMZ73861.1 Bifunctional nuclease [Natranaerofaba carboxydovora]
MEVKVKGIGTTNEGDGYAVLLSDMEETKVLPIVVGPFEAQGIISILKDYEPPRPMTYDLTKTLCETLEGYIEKIVITDVREDIFYAEIYLQSGGVTHKIDSRPSDAIALALRFEAPIFINFQLVEFTCDYEDLLDEQ